MKSSSAAQATYDRYLSSQFHYGSRDCLTFAFEIIAAFHGISFSYSYDGSVESMLNNFRKLSVRRFEDLFSVSTLESITGVRWTRVPDGHLCKFDLMVCKLGRRVCAGVYEAGNFVSIAPKGIVRIPVYKLRILMSYRPLPEEERCLRQ